MKNTTKLLAAALMAGALPTAALTAAPASAQVVPGIGIANPDAIVVNTAAFRLAEQQRQTTYAAQMQQAEQRRAQISQQLQPLYQQIQTASQQANPNQQQLQQQAAQIQQIEQQAQAELQQIMQPVALSRAYVLEQLSEQFNTALTNVKQRKRLTLVLTPDSVLDADQAYNINQDVVTEMDRLVPSVQIVPPAGWLPRAQREAQAQAQAAQAQQPQQGNAAASGGR
ncbi:OmpH family outer membrane protein [Croceicoccus sp. YJ47]|uniref:OmpH family outer membrane protein n=1 Tax=Croceicoccus sp. YJ47 TaxID=2798724 RepID=UPI0019226018|nr:OmpH family outer membrane protein [Croceicoccus sp. YJ47]QQN73685.1 OmpH family outer membrane protein [Croceicoccus sp. YJ47]